MDTEYDDKMATARGRLRAALRPQTGTEHTWVDWLISNLTPGEADVWSAMAERRTRTAARAHGMRVAEFAEANFDPMTSAPPDVLATLQHIASGGEPDDVEPSSATVTDAVQRSRETASAYDRGWTEAVAHCRAQQARGLDPELWQDRQ